MAEQPTIEENMEAFLKDAAAMEKAISQMGTYIKKVSEEMGVLSAQVRDMGHQDILRKYDGQLGDIEKKMKSFGRTVTDHTEKLGQLNSSLQNQLDVLKEVMDTYEEAMKGIRKFQQAEAAEEKLDHLGNLMTEVSKALQERQNDVTVVESILQDMLDQTKKDSRAFAAIQEDVIEIICKRQEEAIEKAVAKAVDGLEWKILAKIRPIE